MAPIKFEEHIREQLEKREIQPSAASWEKLNAKLDNSSTKKSIKWWIGIAAAVAVWLIVSLFFIGQQNEAIVPIVDNPAKVEPAEKSSEFLEPVQVVSEEKQSQIIPEKVKEEKAAEKFPNEVKQNDKSQDAIASSEPEKSKLKSEDQLSVPKNRMVTENEITPVIPEGKKVNIQDKILNNKIEELVAQVVEKEKEGVKVSDTEVNALLAQAAKELSRKRNFYDRGSVDANELLAQVESEMDQSFRQEVFELLKEGFIKAKTAVASRNY